MKIKELLESLSKISISEIRINGYHFKSIVEVCNSILKGLEDLDVMTWGFTSENDGLVLIIYTEESQDLEEDSEDEENEEKELTVSDVLENIHFDDEDTIVIYDKTDGKVYDSDEDDVFVLCELLCLDVKEYVQIHRGKHQIIEIHLKNY